MEKYAGIDIAKKVHWMCVTDGSGRFLMEPRPYDNDAEGLSRMVADLDLCGGDVAVGMESTGCYWRSCYKVLAEGGYPVSVINPVKTCAERKQGNLGRAKTDRVDCLVVADTLRKQGIPPTLSPDADAAQLRDLCRFRRTVSESLSRAKIQAVALLDQVWPEYPRLFSNTFCAASLAVLRRFAVEAISSTDGLASDLLSASRNRYGAAKAVEVLGLPARDLRRPADRRAAAPSAAPPARPAGLLRGPDRRDRRRGRRPPGRRGPDSAHRPRHRPRHRRPDRRRGRRRDPVPRRQVARGLRGPRPDAPPVGRLRPRQNRIGAASTPTATEFRKRGSAHLHRRGGKALYIAAQASLRADCEFRDFYDRLRAGATPTATPSAPWRRADARRVDDAGRSCARVRRQRAVR